MPEALKDALAALLADTRRLLACAEPDLAEWEDYSRRRNELFRRLREMPTVVDKGRADCAALAQLYTAVLENDRLLVSKIQQQLSEISHELAALTDQRRLVNAYGGGNSSFQTYHRHTA